MAPQPNASNNPLAVLDIHHSQLWRVSGKAENSKSAAIKQFVDAQREAFSDFHKVLAETYCYVYELVKEVKDLEDPTVLKEVEKENPTWIKSPSSMYSAVEQTMKSLKKTKQRWRAPRGADFIRVFMEEPSLAYDPLKFISVLSKNIDIYNAIRLLNACIIKRTEEAKQQTSKKIKITRGHWKAAADLVKSHLKSSVVLDLARGETHVMDMIGVKPEPYGVLLPGEGPKKVFDLFFESTSDKDEPKNPDEENGNGPVEEEPRADDDEEKLATTLRDVINRLDAEKRAMIRKEDTSGKEHQATHIP
ncbi:hypothetical protein GLAREA_08496 [Glarea lozoyensis ATCC 20868]|uniref:Uncharacterized protein n=1 Tax=Glarea lozoyensis (strain ATCC 20868 / MF5171) TaxID=1116229 RepID=S3DD87_GLAL2|nr:uncharacterized protein GLAREA_08496 [Glarea lozoyensis ATCC 20868]EPE24643.1 hypothetical protein GLAREA_08496 [Glarea lozoyensis ATCC 20868]